MESDQPELVQETVEEHPKRGRPRHVKLTSILPGSFRIGNQTWGPGETKTFEGKVPLAVSKWIGKVLKEED